MSEDRVPNFLFDCSLLHRPSLEIAKAAIWTYSYFLQGEKLILKEEGCMLLTGKQSRETRCM